MKKLERVFVGTIMCCWIVLAVGFTGLAVVSMAAVGMESCDE